MQSILKSGSFSVLPFYGNNRAYRHYKFAIRVTNGSTHRQFQEHS